MKDRDLQQSLVVTDTSFQEEVLQSEMPILVDFWKERVVEVQPKSQLTQLIESYAA